MISRIKKNDKVFVIAGKNKGGQGLVLDVNLLENKVMVQGLGMVTKHIKPRRQGELGSIKKQEGYMSLSSVMPFCENCKKPSRVVAIGQMKNDKKMRACNRCKETM